MSKEYNPYNGGHFLRRSAYIAPKPQLPTHIEEIEQKAQSSNNSSTYPLQQSVDTQDHIKHECYDPTVMGSHPPIEESDSA